MGGGVIYFACIMFVNVLLLLQRKHCLTHTETFSNLFNACHQIKLTKCDETKNALNSKTVRASHTVSTKENR